MNAWLYIGYLGAVIALIGYPGPNVLLLLNHAVRYGRRGILYNVAGSATASMILMCISLFGVQAIVTPTMLIYLSLIGALYLLVLGAQNLFTMQLANMSSTPAFQPGFSCLRQAFLVGISNPKDILFFVVFLPQFIDTNLPMWLGFALLIISWGVLDWAIMLTYGFVIERISRQNFKIIMVLAKVSGCIMVVIALLMLMSSLNHLGIFVQPNG